MVKRSVIKLIEKNNIANDLKMAYKLMLLSRGYSEEEIRVLDDYVFSVRKMDDNEISNDDVIPLKKRRKRNLPKSLVCLTSESTVYNKRDHTLYTLNGGNPVTKGRFIWSVISLYQKENTPKYEEVRQLFNHKLNLLGYTVIDESSLDALRPDKQRRFYYHDSDLLNSSDGIRYAVSNQWSKDKMDEIISFARSRGWSVEIIKPITDAQ